MKAKSLSLPVLTEEEMTEIMEESLIISKETVKKAAFYVEYSDNIVTIMHEAKHDFKSKEMHVEDKKPWLVNLEEVEMSKKKVLQFSNQVDKIYSMERTNSNELLVKKIQSKNCFPGLSLEIRTKLQLNKNQMCLHFLKCLEKNGLLNLSENEKVVKIFENKSQMSEAGKQLMERLETKLRKKLVTNDEGSVGIAENTISNEKSDAKDAIEVKSSKILMEGESEQSGAEEDN